MILRSYQQEAVNSIYDYFQRSNGNPLVAMPTATGKSLVIAEFIRRMFQHYPMSRVIVLTHVKELIQQNLDHLLRIWPNAPVGIYSAGLEQRDTIMPIIFGGIASVYRRPEMFGHRDIMFIDEAHLLSPDQDTMYQQFISALRKINSCLKVVGLTATWFRLGQGLLTDSGLFSDICFNICDREGFNRLIYEGYLCPPIPKTTRTKLDTSEVEVQKGEYVLGQLQKAVDRSDINYQALSELCEYGRDRKSWLIFCSGIEHADHCAEMLNSFGVSTCSIHSKVPPKERTRRYLAWKAGEYQAATNNNVLTTGVDHPPIDLIGMLRPTMSPVLWVQMVGRGTRVYPGKRNCLVLDFAGNTARLGPINDPVIPRPKGPGTGEVPVKICDQCGAYNHIRNKFCDDCGAEFTFEQKITRTAATHELLAGGIPVVETFDIDRIIYNRHVGKKAKEHGNQGKASIRISYLCGLRQFNEFVTFDFIGLPKHQANEWWRARHVEPPPDSTDLALRRIMELRTPRKVKVWVNTKYPKVMGVIW